MANTNLPHNQGLSVAGLNQGGSCTVGANRADTIDQLDSAGLLTTKAVNFPGLVTVAEVAISDTAGSTDFVVPFACKVIFGYLVKGAGGTGGAADTFQLFGVTNAGASTAITPANALVGVAAKSLALCQSLDLAAGTLEAGGILRCTTVKGTTSVDGTLYVHLLSV